MFPGIALVPVILLGGAAIVGTVALLKLTESYLERRRLEARFRQIKEDVDAINVRLRALGEDAGLLEDQLASVSRRADKMLAEGDYPGAVALLANAVKSAEDHREIVEARIEKRVENLQRRFQMLHRRAAELSAAREQLVAFAGTNIPSDWPASERARLTEQFRTELARITILQPPPADLSEAGTAQLTQAERELNAATQGVEEVRKNFAAEINRAHARHVATRLGANAPASTMLAEWLATNPAVVAPPAAAERGILEKLDALLVQIGALQDTAGWSELMRRAEAVRSEADAGRRRRFYENLVLDCSARLKQLRATQAWIAELDKLIEDAAAYAGTAVDEVATALRDLRRAGRPEVLAPWRERLAATQQRELARLERERKRQAILDSLADLGYETNAGLETALVQAGKLVVRKPGESDYAVEIVSDAGLSMVQTTMVRYSDTPELTEQQRRRDTEREDEWCADHARLRERLAKQGLATSFKLKLPSGEHPVKIVPREHQPAAPAQAKGKLQQGS